MDAQEQQRLQSLLNQTETHLSMAHERSYSIPQEETSRYIFEDLIIAVKSLHAAVSSLVQT